MRVMTYNIQLGISEGLEPIAEIIAGQDPDIVALQEVGKHWTMGPEGDSTTFLAEHVGLDHSHYVTTIEREENRRYGHALLSRWPIESPRVARFTRREDEPRAALIARMTPPSRDPIRVISTHLSHKEDERAIHGRELVELTERILAYGEPTLLLGDLNEEMDATWLRTLGARMVDAGGINGAKTFENPEPTERIDYVLVRGAEVTKARVLEEPTASDHRPLVVELDLDERADAAHRTDQPSAAAPREDDPS
ncbi:MAG: endonuclease/exonuclease/phosphatase family protein [Persicimonas sp.]